MPKKLVFFAFQGEKMCFTHLLINALDMKEKGINVKIVIEGQACRLIKDMIIEENSLLKKVMDLGLIDSVCRACSNQMGVLEFIESQTKLKLNSDLMGHPPMSDYISDGFQLVIL